jgi:restriction system protein
MSDEHSSPRPVHHVIDGSRDSELIAAFDEQYRRAVIRAQSVDPPSVRPLPPVFAYDGSVDAAAIASHEAQRRRAYQAATTGNLNVPLSPVVAGDFPGVVSQAVVVPYTKTTEGELIRAVTIPLLRIITMISNDPARMFEIDPRKWEEIVAASYAESGLFDEVTLTPRSGDGGRDVIAVKNGYGSVRLIESVKRYRPGNEVTAEQVQALLGVLHSDPKASKGIVSTTWEFAPRIRDNPAITQFLPTRLELVNGAALIVRFKEYTKGRGTP